MPRPTTIYAAILAEHGNADEQYPRPLTCDVCCARPDHTKWDRNGDPAGYWYITESDPLPEGWQVITDPTYKHSLTMCPSCYADCAEGRELELDY